MHAQDLRTARTITAYRDETKRHADVVS
jgi:hypothetical protein